jgi:acyl-CoA hydrolase
MMSDAYVDLYEAGKITGLMKKNEPGKMVYTFALGTKRLYEFLDHNAACASFPVRYVNSVNAVAANDRMVSINNALEVDLFGQVSSESFAGRQISGTGGQWDYHYGSFYSREGKGYICLHSTYRDKDGSTRSRIVPSFGEGTVVTIPRSQAFIIVTEYGMADLKGKSVRERAEALIAIAHPDFRDMLVKEADRIGIWRRP